MLTIGVEEAAVASAVGFAIDVNGDLNGAAVATDAATAAGAIIGYVPAINANAAVACQRRVTLNSGDTIRPVGGKFSGGTFDLVIDGLTMSVIPQ